MLTGLSTALERRSPSVQTTASGLMDVMTASPLTAANFFIVKNIDAYEGTFPLLGGGRVGEFLVYTNVLTEAERLGIESYLQRKWKGGAQIGAQQVAAGATLVTDAAAGDKVHVSGVAGEGLWRKTGGGTVGLTVTPRLGAATVMSFVVVPEVSPPESTTYTQVAP